MSLPNRSYSVADINREKNVHQSNSTATHPLLYQRSFSYVKTSNENDFQPPTHDEHVYRAEKYHQVKREHFELSFFKSLFDFDF